MHIPCWQVPGLVHASPSSQALPSGSGLAPTQTPDWQVPGLVQALPSSQMGPVKSAQVPSTAAPKATEQASQGPALQEVSQQTPSAQKPLWQSAASPQAPPGGAKVKYSSALAR